MVTLPFSKKSMGWLCERSKRFDPRSYRNGQDLCRLGRTPDRVDGGTCGQTFAEAGTTTTGTLDHPTAGIGQGHHPFPSAIGRWTETSLDDRGAYRGYHRVSKSKTKKTLSLLPGNHSRKPLPSPILPRNQGSLF